MTSFLLWHIFFVTMINFVSNYQDVVAKYKSYLILEKILNASIIDFNKKLIPLINANDQTDDMTINNFLLPNTEMAFDSTLNEFESTIEHPSIKSTVLRKNSSITNANLPTNDDNLNTKIFSSNTTDEMLTSKLTLRNKTESSSSDLKDNLSTDKFSSRKNNTYNIDLNDTTLSVKSSLNNNITTSNSTKTSDIHNVSRPSRRGLADKLDGALGQLDDSGRDELFYEPFWPKGQHVFMRTGTKQVTLPQNPIDINRDCDKICSVFEDVWYGRICACRRDDWWIDLIYANFSSLCAMEVANCVVETKRPAWFPIHRGPCTYSKNPYDFLSTFDEFYGANTDRFFSRAVYYESKYFELYPTRPGYGKK